MSLQCCTALTQITLFEKFNKRCLWFNFAYLRILLAPTFESDFYCHLLKKHVKSEMPKFISRDNSQVSLYVSISVSPHANVELSFRTFIETYVYFLVYTFDNNNVHSFIDSKPSILIVSDTRVHVRMLSAKKRHGWTQKNGRVFRVFAFPTFADDETIDISGILVAFTIRRAQVFGLHWS